MLARRGGREGLPFHTEDTEGYGKNSWRGSLRLVVLSVLSV
jgi:hypothetical protein